VVLRQLSNLIANVLKTKRAIGKQKKYFQTTKGCLHGLKIGEFCRTNGLDYVYPFHRLQDLAFSFTQSPPKLSQPNFVTCSAVSRYI